MCAEEDPEGCHRRLLVGRVLGDDGVDVVHIRGDGRLEPERATTLFRPEGAAWRSAGPVKKPRGR
jgi:hypothetical protein